MTCFSKPNAAEKTLLWWCSVSKDYSTNKGEDFRPTAHISGSVFMQSSQNRVMKSCSLLHMASVFF